MNRIEDVQTQTDEMHRAAITKHSIAFRKNSTSTTSTMGTELSNSSSFAVEVTDQMSRVEGMKNDDSHSPMSKSRCSDSEGVIDSFAISTQQSLATNSSPQLHSFSQSVLSRNLESVRVIPPEVDSSSCMECSSEFSDSDSNSSRGSSVNDDDSNDLVAETQSGNIRGSVRAQRNPGSSVSISPEKTLSSFASALPISTRQQHMQPHQQQESVAVTVSQHHEVSLTKERDNEFEQRQKNSHEPHFIGSDLGSDNSGSESENESDDGVESSSDDDEFNDLMAEMQSGHLGAMLAQKMNSARPNVSAEKNADTAFTTSLSSAMAQECLTSQPYMQPQPEQVQELTTIIIPQPQELQTPKEQAKQHHDNLDQDNIGSEMDSDDTGTENDSDSDEDSFSGSDSDDDELNDLMAEMQSGPLGAMLAQKMNSARPNVSAEKNADTAVTTSLSSAMAQECLTSQPYMQPQPEQVQELTTIIIPQPQELQTPKEQAKQHHNNLDQDNIGSEMDSDDTGTENDSDSDEDSFSGSDSDDDEFNDLMAEMHSGPLGAMLAQKMASVQPQLSERPDNLPQGLVSSTSVDQQYTTTNKGNIDQKQRYKPPEPLIIEQIMVTEDEESDQESGSGTEEDSSDYSSSEDDEYSDLMADMKLGGPLGAILARKTAQEQTNDPVSTTITTNTPALAAVKQINALNTSASVPHHPPSALLQPPEIAGLISDNDDDESNSSSEYSTSSGSYSSDDDDEEYADLINSMARPLATPVSRPRLPVVPSKTPTKTPASGTNPLMPIGMDSGLGNPLDGLAMLQNIRADLEKVGRMIVAKKDGQQFLKRAQILASINWLATNVPSCVVDHLGKEIRGVLDASGKLDSLKLSRLRQAIDREVHIMKSDESDSSEMSLTCGIDEADEFEAYDTFSVSCRNSPVKIQRPVFNLDMDDFKSHGLTELDGVSDTNRGKANSSTYSISRREENIPYVEFFKGALMFVDISGFTKLSTVMDPENLSKVINSYFKKLVDKVIEYGGDIQKFAGDAFFAEWRESKTNTISQSVGAAAACAASMVKECGDFPIFSFGEMTSGVECAPISTLNVHCGLGIGEMIGIHVGDSAHRREYMYVGDPIDQATKACDGAELGEAKVSEEFSEILSQLDPAWASTKNDGANQNVIASRHETKVKLPEYKAVRNAKSRGITEHVDGLQVEALIEYRRLMSLYVHPVVVSNDVAASNNFKSSTIQVRRKDEAELRSVFVVFINPAIDLDLKKSRDIKGAAAIMNNVMNIITRELKQYSGHLRQFVVDDKGFVAIATFGLRGSTYPNMVSERALPATLSISQTLEMELGVKSKIGATFGDVYCGPVGGENRHEFAVMGPSVNLAARLMCSDKNPGVLVDNAVRKIASQSFSFNALEPVIAKGYADPVPIFEPLASQNRVWGKLEPNFAGRQSEIDKLVSSAKEILSSNNNAGSKLIMIEGQSGLGKTALLTQSIYEIRRSLGAKSGLVVAKHAGVECDVITPFSTVRSLLFNVARSVRVSSDDVSHLSGLSGVLGDDVSMCSDGSSTVAVDGRSLETLLNISNELSYPKVITDLGKQYLFGNAADNTLNHRPKHKSSFMSAVASFIAQIFIRCIQDLKLFLIALDDVHRADELSWEVLQQVFEGVGNVMIVATTYAFTNYSIRVSKDFWEALNAKYLNSNQFTKMELQKLNEDDMIVMTMKTLGLQRKEVKAEILNAVTVQSGGVPRFASKILDGIKNGSHSQIGVVDDDAVTEIILHRVDSFDIAVRLVLNVAAVLGSSFTLGELICVIMSNNDAKEADVRSETIVSLQTIVKEGILYIGESLESDQDVTAIKGDNNMKFTFYQDVWRRTVLGLMLGSRKKDVHKKIAASLEAFPDEKKRSFEYHSRVFNHWKCSGDTAKTTTCALATGKFLEEQDQPYQSIPIYEDALGMWGWDKSSSSSIGGCSKNVLDLINAAELSKILALSVARGRAFKLSNNHKESVNSFESAIHIKQSAKHTSQLNDRSIIFPAFVGISNALAKGHVQQDVYRRYEQGVIHQFLEETRMHGRLIHHIYALFLQMDLYSNQGEIEKAIAVQSIMKKLYKPDKHSKGLRNIYGIDAGALSFSLCANFFMYKGNTRQALKTARYVLKELVPKMEATFNQSFSLVYPLIFVLKEAGYSAEAHAFFEKIVILPFGDVAEELEPCILSVYKPLALLLSLSAKGKVSAEKMDECLKWTEDKSVMCFGDEINLHLGRLGHSADSISAEICAILAKSMKKGQHRAEIIRLGQDIVEKAVVFLRKNGLHPALKQAHEIRKKLEHITTGNQNHPKQAKKRNSIAFK